MPRLRSPYDWRLFVLRLRTEKCLGVSQEMLARKLSVTVAAVSRWERGLAVPNNKFRNRLKNLAVRAGFLEHDWPMLSIGEAEELVLGKIFRDRQSLN